MSAEFLPPILKSGRQITVRLERELGDLALTASEALLLSYLQGRDPCPIPMLNRDFGHKRSTLASMLDRLHVRRLILREINPEDRRSLIVRLTRSGQATAKRIQRMLEAFEEEINQRISQKDAGGFHSVMSAIDEIVEKQQLTIDKE